jgi:hypothetical protein
VLRGDLPCGPYATDAWRVFVESVARSDHPATFSRRIADATVGLVSTAVSGSIG